MPKSIIDIDVNDARFKEFHALYTKYADSLKSQPADWQKVGGAADKTLSSVEAIAAATFAQTEALSAVLARQKAASAQARQLSSAWVDIAASTKRVGVNIAEATEKLLKWTGIIGGLSGLLGAGGIYGIERLGLSAAAGRRSAQGLGTTYGGQSAFSINYGRVVDPSAVLAGVNQSLTDPSRRSALYAAGLTEGDIRGKTTDQVADLLLQRIKQTADRTPTSALGAVYGARHLGQFISPEDFQRLRATSPQEMQRFHQGFLRDQGSLGLGDETLRKWQDFTVQLDRAGAEIKAVLIDGLQPLAKPIADLSDSVVKAVRSLLGSPHLGEDIEAVGHGFEYVAKYLGSSAFQSDMRSVGDAMAALAGKLKSVLDYLGITPQKNAAAPSGIGGPNDIAMGDLLATANAAQQRGHPLVMPGGTPSGANNYFGLRPPGASKGFQNFGSADDGARAAFRQVYRDEYVYGQDTLRQLVYGNANHGGYTATDRDSYLANLVKQTGIGADEKLDYRNDSQIAAIVAAIGRNESGAHLTPKVILEVNNNTGGNAVISTSQIPQ